MCCLGVGALLLVGLGLVQAAAQTTVLDRILAIVDGKIIMQSDVQAFIDLGLADVLPGLNEERDVLTFLIDRRVALDQVDRFVVAEPDADLVDRRIELVRRRLPDGTDLGFILDRVGLTSLDLRQIVADDIRRDAYLLDRFGVVPEGLREEAIADWVAGLVRRAQIRQVSGAEEPADAASP